MTAILYSVCTCYERDRWACLHDQTTAPWWLQPGQQCVSNWCNSYQAALLVKGFLFSADFILARKLQCQTHGIILCHSVRYWRKLAHNARSFHGNGNGWFIKYQSVISSIQAAAIKSTTQPRTMPAFCKRCGSGLKPTNMISGWRHDGNRQPKARYTWRHHHGPWKWGSEDTGAGQSAHLSMCFQPPSTCHLFVASKPRNQSLYAPASYNFW